MGGGDGIATWDNGHENCTAKAVCHLLLGFGTSCIVFILLLFFLSRLFFSGICGGFSKKGHGNTDVTCTEALGSTSIARKRLFGEFRLDPREIRMKNLSNFMVDPGNNFS